MGCEIIENLILNTTLERIELEGNEIGPNTLKAISKLLLKNTTMKFIDLEGNDLTKQGSDISGIEALIDSLS